MNVVLPKPGMDHLCLLDHHDQRHSSLHVRLLLWSNPPDRAQSSQDCRGLSRGRPCHHALRSGDGDYDHNDNSAEDVEISRVTYQWEALDFIIMYTLMTKLYGRSKQILHYKID